MGNLIKRGRKRSFLLITNPHPQNNHTEFLQPSCNNFPSQSRTRLHSKRDTDAGQLSDEQHGLRLLHVGNDIFSIFNVRKAWGGVSSRPIVSRTSTTLIRGKWIEEAKPRLTNFPRRSYAAKEIHNSFRDIQERGSRLLRQALPPSGI